MMKLVGIVGSNADQSYNRDLLSYMSRAYRDLVQLEVVEIKDLPLFNQDDDQTQGPAVQRLVGKIEGADGVVIATPEHNHTIPPALKNAIEWLSYKVHPLTNKPVMVVGCSYYDQGASRSQLVLRRILNNAPGVGAVVMPGNEFLLGNVKEAFDGDGNLVDAKTRDYLSETLNKFLRFVRVVKLLEEPEESELPAAPTGGLMNLEEIMAAIKPYVDFYQAHQQSPLTSDVNQATDLTSSASWQVHEASMQGEPSQQARFVDLRESSAHVPEVVDVTSSASHKPNASPELRATLAAEKASAPQVDAISGATKDPKKGE